MAKQGLNKLGVETVATEAGMDKAMLYRHYKDFNDILRTYVEQENFWINFLGDYEDFEYRNHQVGFLQKMVIAQFEELIKNDKLQQLLIWELVDTGGFMKDIAQKREDMASGILKDMQTYFPHKKVSSNNIRAIITDGIYYLALHKNITTFCTIDLSNKEHKKNLYPTYCGLLNVFFRQ